MIGGLWQFMWYPLSQASQNSIASWQWNNTSQQSTHLKRLFIRMFTMFECVFIHTFITLMMKTVPWTEFVDIKKDCSFEWYDLKLLINAMFNTKQFCYSANNNTVEHCYNDVSSCQNCLTLITTKIHNSVTTTSVTLYCWNGAFFLIEIQITSWELPHAYTVLFVVLLLVPKPPYSIVICCEAPQTITDVALYQTYVLLLI